MLIGIPPSYGEFNITLSATPTSSSLASVASVSTTGKSVTVKSRKNSISNPRYPYVWSSVYVDDVDSDYASAFSYEHTQAVNALYAKLGVTVVPYGKISRDTDWTNTVIDSILSSDDLLYDMPADIFVFSGHGLVGRDDPRMLSWQGAMCAHFPGSSYLQGSGLTAFVSLTQYLATQGSGWFGALGPALHNYLSWDLTTGRWSNWQVNRCLKFVFVSGCESGRGLLSMAFGIPRGRHPGLGRAYLSYKNKVGIVDAKTFAQRFWTEWKKSGVNLAQAAWRARCSTNMRVDYVIHGDPNLTIW